MSVKLIKNIAQSSGNRQGTTRDALFIINNAGKGSPAKNIIAHQKDETRRIILW